MKTSLLFICVLLLFNGTYSQGSSDRSHIRLLLSNPDILPPYSTEFPYLVSIQMNHQHLCAGTLISSHHVVTAAHCVHEIIVRRDVDLAKQLTILAGFAGGKSFVQKSRVRRLSMHPDYEHDDKTYLYQHDVAVITVSDPFSQTDHVRTLDPFVSISLEKDTVLKAGGFGSNVYKDNIISYVQKSNVNVVNDDVCMEQFLLEHVTHYSVICVEKIGILGTDMDDTGGPVVAENVFVGILSRGNGITDILTPVSPNMMYIAQERTRHFHQILEKPNAFDLDQLRLGKPKTHSREFFYPWQPRPFLPRPPRIFYYPVRTDQDDVKLVFLDQRGYPGQLLTSEKREHLIPVVPQTTYVL